MAPVIFKANNGLVESFLFFEYLQLPLLLPAEENSAFKGITWLAQAYPYNLHTLKSVTWDFSYICKIPILQYLD